MGRGREQGKAETLTQLFCKASLEEPPATPSFLPQVKDLPPTQPPMYQGGPSLAQTRGKAPSPWREESLKGGVSRINEAQTRSPPAHPPQPPARLPHRWGSREGTSPPRLERPSCGVPEVGSAPCPAPCGQGLPSAGRGSGGAAQGGEESPGAGSTTQRVAPGTRPSASSERGRSAAPKRRLGAACRKAEEGESPGCCDRRNRWTLCRDASAGKVRRRDSPLGRRIWGGGGEKENERERERTERKKERKNEDR